MLVLVLAAQSCPTLCNPMDCSPPGSSVHEIFQARILEWVAISFSRESSHPRDRTRVSCTAGRFFYWLSYFSFIWASLIVQLGKNLPVIQETTLRSLWIDSWVRKICWRRDRLPTPVFLDFLCGSAGKESTCNAGDLSSISGLGRFPGEGKGYPL